MARHKLTDSKVKALTKPGVYGDGDMLYLRVHPGGSKSWFFIYRRHGVRRELGLGSYGGAVSINLANARRKADAFRDMLAEDRDPFAERSTQKASRATFKEVAERYIDEAGDWTTKTQSEWRYHLLVHSAKIANVAIEKVNTELVEEVLRPLWAKKPATGQRVRSKIENVLDYAKAKKLRSGENPARWQGHLEHVLAEAGRVTGANHAAMAYADVPAFLKELGDSPEERCLLFAILTAVRTDEARKARWREIDLATKLWTIPAERMKVKKKEHVVPLSDAAIAALGSPGEGYVFAGRLRDRRPIGHSRMRDVTVEKRPGITVHGFRSAFRDWAGDCTDFPREVAEAALAHAVGDATERAYRRGDALAKRRELMNDWAVYCDKAPH
ncbi:tyrosine-type recombinase/integrase [Allomesorhizobium camelthorni]|uniref:Integrase arm-type DNA-binding domain-containing protein n=1 Tax=Allomesorhizobium camelthorni TaxID=475069 RepID=A0A6G4WAL2_9HYPH|nr:site-specific integrase [Mesorhizobium camelthorni]NGO51639.1 integrase arm-type DNA-binding domain-containing protein [Mesorhizobium camelthorni]